MVGETISHYRILEQLGEGGMGVVYKAQDTTLDRIVALKFLPHHLTVTADDEARFLREARSAAALDHPNICTVYEVGEAEGQTFIAMAYLEGETLQQKVRRTGPLELETALDIMKQIAEGLQAAHEKGIVHRDIKSANIMVSSKGQVRIMDFGLAKSTGRSQLTVEGRVLGTVAYMSPEQARGEPVDHRTDIWALGIVMYEILTSKLPFASEYEQAVIYAILNESPHHVADFRSDIPAFLDQLVAKCLEKNPAARYQNLNEVIADLRKSDKGGGATVVDAEGRVERTTKRSTTRLILGGGIVVAAALMVIVVFYLFRGQQSTSAERRSIVVADCDNSTDDHNLGSLSGLLITSLEQSHLLAVITRSSMFDYLKQMGKGNVDRIDETTGREICSRAGIQLLVVPSVHKLGQRYIIEVKVLNPAKDEYLFTDKVDGVGLDGIYPMIDEIAEKTRRQLQEGSTDVRLSSQRLADVAPASLEAYQHYFQGAQLSSRLLFGKAEEEYRKAILLDRTFAPAYLELARSLGMQGKDGVSEALQSALRHVARAPVKEQYEIKAATSKDAGEREKLYSGLTEMYPNEKANLFWTGDTAFHRGNFATAVQYFEKVIALDPSYKLIDDAMAMQHLIWAYRDLEQYDKMVDRANRFVAMVRTEQAYGLLADAYALKGDLGSALRTYERGEELFPGSTDFIVSRGEVSVMNNDFGQAEKQFRKLVQKSRPADDQRNGWKGFSHMYACLGKFREAYACYDRVFDIDRQMGDSSPLAWDYIEKAFWLAVGTKDSVAARKTVEIGLHLPHNAGGFFYYKLRDAYMAMHEYNEADSLGRKYSLSFTEEGVKAYVSWAHKNYDSAAVRFRALTERGHLVYKLLYSYDLARLYEEAGQYEKAVEVVQRFHTIHNNEMGRRCAYYPRSLYLLGRIFEKMGDRKLAVENTRAFLAMWKDADKDLPELAEAKGRLERLGVNN